MTSTSYPSTKTLILPSCGHGGVGQLALDALMNTVICASPSTKRRTFLTAHVSPMASTMALDDDASALVGAVEWIETDEAVLLQIRAPVLPGHARMLADEICAWASAAARVLVLGGIDANSRSDEQMRSLQIRAIATTASRGGGEWAREGCVPLKATVGQDAFASLSTGVASAASKSSAPPTPPTVDDDGGAGSVSLAAAALVDGYCGLLVPLLEARERAGAKGLGLAVWTDETAANFVRSLELGALGAAQLGAGVLIAEGVALRPPQSWAVAQRGRECDPSLFM